MEKGDGFRITADKSETSFENTSFVPSVFVIGVQWVARKLL
jgi:hypothetical protein